MLVVEEVKREAKALGFSACGLARVEVAESEMAPYDAWIAKGYQAGMHYMANHRPLRRDPEGLLEGAKSIISVALNYYPQHLLPKEAPQVAYYAYGKDYHVVVKERLRQLGERLGLSDEIRCFTDSAPLFERYWAWRAGLGWIGKNGCLIVPHKGSFFFLGELVTTAEADAYDQPQRSRCGRCRRCLEACPTGALEAPRLLNANKCLSYLTIEHRDEIPAEQVRRMGNRFYGCDTCQLVCPWNRFAQPTQEAAFQPTEALLSLDREQLEHFTPEAYQRLFAGSAAKRAKYAGLLRNAKAWLAAQEKLS